MKASDFFQPAKTRTSPRGEEIFFIRSLLPNETLLQPGESTGCVIRNHKKYEIYIESLSDEDCDDNYHYTVNKITIQYTEDGFGNEDGTIAIKINEKLSRAEFKERNFANQPPIKLFIDELHAALKGYPADSKSVYFKTTDNRDARIFLGSIGILDDVPHKNTFYCKEEQLVKSLEQMFGVTLLERQPTEIVSRSYSSSSSRFHRKQKTEATLESGCGSKTEAHCVIS